jgi:hypothetical protein
MPETLDRKRCTHQHFSSGIAAAVGHRKSSMCGITDSRIVTIFDPELPFLVVVAPEIFAKAYTVAIQFVCITELSHHRGHSRLHLKKGFNQLTTNIATHIGQKMNPVPNFLLRIV